MIDGYMGDVINISSLSFDILEVDPFSFQSTGTIVHVPNSKVFSEVTKNYVKAFKYIWGEIEVKVNIDSDLKRAKSKLYRIVNSNEVIKRIPNKMRGSLEVNDKYRIYYNKLEPIIYMNVSGSYVSLYIRFLIHPKKKRNIENEIWSEYTSVIIIKNYLCMWKSRLKTYFSFPLLIMFLSIPFSIEKYSASAPIKLSAPDHKVYVKFKSVNDILNKIPITTDIIILFKHK